MDTWDIHVYLYMELCISIVAVIIRVPFSLVTCVAFEHNFVGCQKATAPGSTPVTFYETKHLQTLTKENLHDIPSLMYAEWL